MKMDKSFCRVNYFNHQITSHDYTITRQWQDEHKRWHVKELCKLCDYERVTLAGKPISVTPNVEF